MLGSFWTALNPFIDRDTQEFYEAMPRNKKTSLEHKVNNELPVLKSIIKILSENQEEDQEAIAQLLTLCAGERKDLDKAVVQHLKIKYPALLNEQSSVAIGVQKYIRCYYIQGGDKLYSHSVVRA